MSRYLPRYACQLSSPRLREPTDGFSYLVRSQATGDGPATARQIAHYLCMLGDFARSRSYKKRENAGNRPKALQLFTSARLMHLGRPTARPIADVFGGSIAA